MASLLCLSATDIEWLAAGFSRLPLFLPVVFIWYILLKNNGLGLGMNFFLAEQPTHYNLRGDDETEGSRIIRLFLSSPSIWTQGFLSVYISLFWVISLYSPTLLGDAQNPNPEFSVTAPVFIGSHVLSVVIFTAGLFLKNDDENRNWSSKFFEALRAALSVLVFVLLFVCIYDNAADIVSWFKALALVAWLFTHHWPAANLCSILIWAAVYLLAMNAVLWSIHLVRPIAGVYVQFLFFLYMAAYTAFISIPQNYRIRALIGVAVWIILVFLLNKIVLRKFLRFDGIRDKDGDLYKVWGRRDDGRIPRSGDTLPDSQNKLDPVLTLKNWKKHAQMAQGLGETQKPKLVLVATTGGASRSAYWTTLVLDQLTRLGLGNGQNSPKGITESIRVIAGASGGMVGASFFTMTRNDDGYPSTDCATKAMEDTAETFNARNFKRSFWLPRDTITRIINQLVISDLMQVLVPFAFRIPNRDRGHTLEEQFGRFGRTSGKGAPTFADVWDDEAAGTRPSMIYSPMMIESGALLLISNLNLRGIREEVSGENTHSVEFFDLFPDPTCRKEFTLATAARMSAAFPYISPAVSLPTIPRRRMVDAGYYDGYGTNLIAAFLLNPNVRGWIKENTNGVAVLELWDSPREPKIKDASVFKRAFQFLTSPIEGMFAARQSTMIFRNDQLLNQAKVAYGNTSPVQSADAKRTGFVRSYRIRNTLPAISMNWYVPDVEFDQLQDLLSDDSQEPAQAIADLAVEWTRDWRP